MRTSNSINQKEVDAYTQSATENKIITDGDVGVKNADIFCNPIINRNSDITPQALSLSFSQVQSQLKFKSAARSKADDLALKLSPTEAEAYRNWAARQSRWIGLDGSEEGFENCASLLAWMRGNPVTEHNLDLGLGNIINNPQVWPYSLRATAEARSCIRTRWKDKSRVQKGRAEARSHAPARVRQWT